MAREVVIVPHTHWDREWYAPFQTFRLRLVELIDGLLTLLERDPGYAHFLLDGQMAVVDDYLAMRPHQEDRLRRLAAAGRLAVGPWYVLMDEFLVSGETIVRDLQRGLVRAAAFGGATEVGYLPDMFGHVAQMPQLLRQSGLEHAVVWRGVPAAVDRSGFWWRAPDGSTVRAEYLPDGYGNGAALPQDAKELVAAVDRFVEHHGDLLAGPVLWMHGTDHLPPRPWLSRVVDEANAFQDDYHLRVDSLAAYLRQAPTEGLPEWTGELRSGARANLLMGVASNRVDVKQAAAAAERQLERYAEPLSALFRPAADWPEAFLGEAWLALLRNAAHDSSCACSHDEVVDAVLVRYQEARQIAEGLTERAVAAAASGLAAAGPVVVNPSARTRSAVVELTLPGHRPGPGTQLISCWGGHQVTEGITCTQAAVLVQAALDEVAGLGATTGRGADGALEVHLDLAADAADALHAVAARGEALGALRRAATTTPDAPARVTLDRPEEHRALVAVADVPGFGWARWPGPAGAAPTPLTELPAPPSELVVTEGDDAPRAAPGAAVRVVNGELTVTVATDGTIGLHDGVSGVGVTGLGRLVDDGDAGDTYNYSPPGRDEVIGHPDHVEVAVSERGPLRARVVVTARYTWPARVVDDARCDPQPTEVTTVIEVVAASPVVRVTAELDHRHRDHRLRAWFPLPTPADRSRAECAFGVTERGLEAEGGPTEVALPTFPSRRFVCAGGLTVVHDGLLEYELVDRHDGRAHALALTLLRATGMLSRGPMTNRPLPAGPSLPTPGAQVPGHRVLRYGVRLGDVVDDAYAAVDDAFVPLAVARAPGGGDRPDRGRALAVEGAEVSAVRRTAGGHLEVRVFNPSSSSATVRLPGRHGWLTDLRGRVQGTFEGSVELAPWRVATLVVAEP